LERKRQDKTICPYNDIENGGVKMLDIQSMILSQRIITLKRYIEEYSNLWKNILDTFLGEVGGKFILHCNFDTRKLPIYLPDFYKECLMRHGLI